jgi:hypothetical protein
METNGGILMTAAADFATARMIELFEEKAATYADAPQMRVIIECIADLYQSGEIPSATAVQLVKDLEADHDAFHSSEVQPEGSESWQAQRSIQLLFAKSVKTDEAFRRRARAYLRENIVWLGSFFAATGLSG